jgi:hypothetical protein
MAEIIKKYTLESGDTCEVYDDGKTIVRSAKTGRVLESTTPPDTARLYSELGNAALDAMSAEEREEEEKQAQLDMDLLLDQLGLTGDQAAMLYGRLAFRGGVAAVRAIKELVQLSEDRRASEKKEPEKVIERLHCPQCGYDFGERPIVPKERIGRILWVMEQHYFKKHPSERPDSKDLDRYLRSEDPK